jgi:DNA-directed RNA polymerase specialized sigma24 family protein
MNEDEARDREAEEKRIADPLAAALFQEHAGWLRRYVRRLADNRSLPPSLLDPDDVVQEAFVQLLRHNWAEPIRNPGAWLCVVARTQCVARCCRLGEIRSSSPTGDPALGTLCPATFVDLPSSGSSSPLLHSSSPSAEFPGG